MRRADWNTTDYYAVLGIGPGSSAAAVNTAFREIARTSHPDRHPGDPQARARFEAARAAVEVLGDPVLRHAYDEVRRSVPAPAVPADPPLRRAIPLGDQLPDFDRTARRRHLRIFLGWFLIVAGVALGVVVAVAVHGGSGPGGDQTGRQITLWLVAIKFMIAGLLVLLYPAIRRGVRARQARQRRTAPPGTVAPGPAA